MTMVLVFIVLYCPFILLLIVLPLQYSVEVVDKEKKRKRKGGDEGRDDFSHH